MGGSLAPAGWRDSNKTPRTSRDWVGQEEGLGWGGQRGPWQEGRARSGPPRPRPLQQATPPGGWAQKRRRPPRSRAGVTDGLRPGAGAAEVERVPHVLLCRHPPPAPALRRRSRAPPLVPEVGGAQSGVGEAAGALGWVAHQPPPPRHGPARPPGPSPRSVPCSPAPFPLRASERASGDLSNGAQRSPFFSLLAPAPGGSWRGASAPARDECCGRSRVQHPAGHRLVQGGAAMRASGPGATGARAAGWGRWRSRNAAAQGWRRGPEAGPAPRRGRGRRLGGMGARCRYGPCRRPWLPGWVDRMRLPDGRAG